MNKRYITIMVLLLVFATNNLCGKQSEDSYIYYRSGSMVEVDGTLTVGFTMDVVGEAISRLEGVKITPSIITESRCFELPDVLVVGNNKNKVYRRWMKLMSKKEHESLRLPNNVIEVKTDKTERLDYIFQIPYQEWMDSAHMVLYVESLRPANRSYSTMITLSEGVKLIPREPYKVDVALSFVAPAPEVKSRKRQGQAFIDFKIGRSEIVPSYRRNSEELEKVRQALNDISNNPDITVNGIYVEGYASPDGSYQVNERLSRERSHAMKQYMVHNFNLPIPSDQIKISSVAEDWNGLRVAIEASDLSGKDHILNIIDNTADINQRKGKLRLLGGEIYQTLLREYLPPLRRIEYQIDYSVKNYSVAEVKVVLEYKHYEMLSQRELFDAAMSYGKGSEEYERIMLDIIPRNYPDDVVSNVNTSAAMIQRGEHTSAKRYLERFESELLTWNNLGVIALLENRLDDAEKYLLKAKANGVEEANHNLQELKTKREDNAKMRRYNR